MPSFLFTPFPVCLLACSNFSDLKVLVSPFRNRSFKGHASLFYNEYKNLKSGCCTGSNLKNLEESCECECMLTYVKVLPGFVHLGVPV